MTTAIEIGVLGNQVAEFLLLAHAEPGGITPCRDKDDALVQRALLLCGGLPLALSVLGSFVHRRGWGLALNVFDGCAPEHASIFVGSVKSARSTPLIFSANRRGKLAVLDEMGTMFQVLGMDADTGRACWVVLGGDMSSTGTLAVLASVDGRVRVWDVERGSLVRVLSETDYCVTCLAVVGGDRTGRGARVVSG